MRKMLQKFSLHPKEFLEALKKLEFSIKKIILLNSLMISIIPFAKSWMLSRFILNILKYINETIIICLIVLGIIILKIYNIPFDNIDFSCRICNCNYKVISKFIKNPKYTYINLNNFTDIE